MPYVYSTMTAGVDYCDYKQSTKDLNSLIRKVSVHGGTNVANRALYTPLGVATKITDEEAAFLEKHPTFIQHKKAGFVKIEAKKHDAEKVAGSMESRDESAPLVPGDFDGSKKGAKPQDIGKKSKSE